MRYRRVSYRYTMVLGSSPSWSFGEPWQNERVRLLVPIRWRPDADIYETATTVQIVVDLAGVDEEDFEVQLFDDVVVVEGRRQLASEAEGAVYHVAGIRQGPFRVELSLPAAVDPDRVDARYDRGLLRIALAKRTEAV
jgi:HSP20 family molecular chaperone IbpA